MIIIKPKNEKIISCEVKIIHRPKPKKLFKVNDCFKGYSKNVNGPRKIPNYNYDIHKKKGTEHNHKNKSNKIDFDSISLEEIEKDFMTFKAKSEVLQVENELLKILLYPSNKGKHNNNIKYKIKKKLDNEEIPCNINCQSKKYQ